MPDRRPKNARRLGGLVGLRCIETLLGRIGPRRPFGFKGQASTRDSTGRPRKSERSGKRRRLGPGTRVPLMLAEPARRGKQRIARRLTSSRPARSEPRSRRSAECRRRRGAACSDGEDSARAQAAPNEDRPIPRTEPWGRALAARTVPGGHGAGAMSSCDGSS